MKFYYFNLFFVLIEGNNKIVNNNLNKRLGDVKTKNEIILFENQQVKLGVNVQDEAVWLSLEQWVNYLVEINLLFRDILRMPYKRS